MNNYRIEITLPNGSSHIINMRTDRLEWAMEQYERNRGPLKWEVIETKPEK